MDPQNAYLLERGLKTLGLRVAQQNATGMAVAQFLEAHPAIERVWYPGLPSHPDHAIARAQMKGFGGVVSFEVNGPLEDTGRFIDALNLPYIAPSLGGVDSLIEQPALMSYFEKTTEERHHRSVRKQGPPRCGLSQRICGIFQGVRESRRRSRTEAYVN